MFKSMVHWWPLVHSDPDSAGLRMLNYVTGHQPVYLYDMCDLFATEVVTKVKPNTNSVEVRSQLSNNWHPADGALVHCGPNTWTQMANWN